MSAYCSSCEKLISTEENSDSMKYFSKPLCAEHQPSEKARKLGWALINKGWGVEFEKEIKIESGSEEARQIAVAVTEANAGIEVDGVQYESKEQALAYLQRTFDPLKPGFLILKIAHPLVASDELIEETAEYINGLLKERVKKIGKGE